MRQPTGFNVHSAANSQSNISRLHPAARLLYTNRQVHQARRPGSQLIGLMTVSRTSHLPVLVALFGGVLLAAGAAAPLIHIPIVGTISYLHHPGYFISSKIGEIVILIAAGVSIVCALLRCFKLLWLTGTVAIAQLIATVAMFLHTTATVVAKADQPALVDPTLMWAGAALQHARLEWGIAVIAAGAAMVLAAAAWELAKTRRKKTT